MTDIYEYKARKYKLKYLKLRRKYIGEGGVIINNGFNIAKRLIEKDDLIKLDIQKQNGEPYFDNIDRFEGILLNVDNYNKIQLIKKYDLYNYNTPIIKYIGQIIYNYNKSIFSRNTKYKIITKYFGENSISKTENNTYYYMISEVIKRSDNKNIFNKLLNNQDNYNYKSYNINYENIKYILNSLKIGIDILITNLYNNNYILDTIDEKNIILKNNKVYFINYSSLQICDDNNKYNDIKALAKFIHWLFKTYTFTFKGNYYPILYGTLELVEELNEDTINTPKDLSNRLNNIINSIIESNTNIDQNFIEETKVFFIKRFTTKLDEIIKNEKNNDNSIVEYINGINKLYDKMNDFPYYKEKYDFNFINIINEFQSIIDYKLSLNLDLNEDKYNYINTLLDKTDYKIKTSIKNLIKNFINKIYISIKEIYKTDEEINIEDDSDINKYINEINKIDKNNDKYKKLKYFLSTCPSHIPPVLKFFNDIKTKLNIEIK
jgi:hypothetical protein